MMSWFYYLLEVNLYIFVFYFFYRLFLDLETFYTLNRCYLLGTSLLAFILPLLQVGYLSSIFPGKDGHGLFYIERSFSGIHNQGDSFTGIFRMIPAFYLTMIIVLSGRFILNFCRIIFLSFRSPKMRERDITYVFLKNSDTSFSFFNLLFINPSSKDRQVIVKHEMVHIRQKHSYDILLVELISILNWFNPVVWMLKKDIRLLHEYIADEATAGTGVQKHRYARMLIQNSLGSVSNQLTNQVFNHSLLKKRIAMLSKKPSNSRARLKTLLFIPVAAIAFCLLAMAFTKDYAFIDLYPVKPPPPPMVAPPPPPSPAPPPPPEMPVSENLFK